MTPHVIQNPVPTPEQMAEILGVSLERLASIRRIMAEPVRKKTPVAISARKRAGFSRTAKSVSSRADRAKSEKN